MTITSTAIVTGAARGIRGGCRQAVGVDVSDEPGVTAHTVSFLASEGAGFASGQVLYVAGGPRA